MVNSCTLICMGAAALFGSMLYVSFNPYKHDVLTQFINTLDTQQQQIFLQIHEERMKIFVLGLIIGLILWNDNFITHVGTWTCALM